MIESEDFSFYEKIKVPPPTFCPECRMIRRFNWRNEGMLFKRPDAHTGKEIFSTFPPDAEVLTYENSFWFGDGWDPMVNGFDFDFTKDFFTQFKELLSKAPIPSRSVFNMINSDYCNEASECRNSYLCFNTDYAENSAYIRKSRYIKDSFDCYESTEIELCYENVMVDKCYQTFFSLDCESCVDVSFSKSLRGCTNCFGCVNLTNKSNYFFNEPCTKEEYQKKVQDLNLQSFESLEKLKEVVLAFWSKFPNKYYHGLRTINSTGEKLFDTKNVKNSYFIKGAENIRYCQDIWSPAANLYDFSVWGDRAENVYECMTCGMGIFNLKFCFNCWEEASNLEYCGYCIGSSNCFGCVGLYKKSYCIFNKQFTKEEYFELVEKIKIYMDTMPYADGQGRVYKYGEFFPYQISPLAYNESLSNDYKPLSPDGAIERGFSWKEIMVRAYDITMKAESLPVITNADEGITKEVVECSECKRAYRIIGSEFQFLKRFSLPIPRMCHNCRFKERFKLVNPSQLWLRVCMCDKEGHNTHQGKCEVEFETSYAPERPEIVYCEKCYQQEVY